MAGKHAWQGGMHGGCVSVAVGECMTGACMAGEIDHCSGWYASYWNAFLFIMELAPAEPLKVQLQRAPYHYEHQTARCERNPVYSIT